MLAVKLSLEAANPGPDVLIIAVSISSEEIRAASVVICGTHQATASKPAIPWTKMASRGPLSQKDIGVGTFSSEHCWISFTSNCLYSRILAEGGELRHFGTL
jgi:hypothetical protein